ncbi:MAG: hypothetical protein ABFQ65_02490 [Nanoarchaeota archaeon]
MNNRGWVRIVEAFFSILLIAGVLLIMVNKGYIGGENISSRVYDLQLSVLREIELNDNLREQILSINENLIPMDDDHLEFPEEVTLKINERIPDSFFCRSKICEIDILCELDEYIDQDVYAQSVAITATLEIYDPRQLKIFCWSD